MCVCVIAVFRSGLEQCVLQHRRPSDDTGAKRIQLRDARHDGVQWKEVLVQHHVSGI